MRKIFVFSLLFISLYGFSQQGQTLSISNPEEVGMSTVGLKKIDSIMQKYIDGTKLPGMITMVARHGKVIQFQKYGEMNVGKPMQSDAIFRIASMTKPITSVGIMILYDERRLQLDDPVSKYIPEFKDLKVFSYQDKNGIHIVEQKKQMTIRNLLTHTSGLGSGMENSYVDSMYKVVDVNEGSLKIEIQKIAKIPLKFQSGTTWQYGLSSDVLGYIIEVVSGKQLDEFFKEKIFYPLKMIDTDYSVPDDKLNRVSAVYSPSKNGIEVLNIPEINNVSPPVKYLRGNGGLLSTASDYMVFTQMLLNKGEYKGARILRRETVELMTSNQLTDEIMPNDEFFGQLMRGMGFGLGFAVLKDPSQTNNIGSKGSYWWMGTANTYFYIDPKEDLIMIFMTQFVPNFYYPVCKEFRELVYKSIIK